MSDENKTSNKTSEALLDSLGENYCWICRGSTIPGVEPACTSNHERIPRYKRRECVAADAAERERRVSRAVKEAEEMARERAA